MKAFCPTSSFRVDAEHSPLRCPVTQEPLEYDNIPAFDLSLIDASQPGHWRYGAMLPVTGPGAVPISMGEGWTPLVPDVFDAQHIHWKLDSQMPTGSYKDRGVSVMINWLVSLGAQRVVEDSSGNAGASIACYAARAGLSACIYVPESAAEPKKAQIAIYGAELVEVPGPRRAAADAAVAATRLDKSTRYASHSLQPASLLGQMTCAWEMWEQLGQQVPDWVIAPVGHGVLLLGIWRGFQRLQSAGLIDRLPKLIGVQAEPFTPLYEAYHNGWSKVRNGYQIYERISADGISVSEPKRASTLLAAIRRSQGKVVAVSDDETIMARDQLATHGVFVEPTSATVAAAIPKLKPLFDENDTVVAVLSGSGLKRLPEVY